jgi:hypothetical protein
MMIRFCACEKSWPQPGDADGIWLCGESGELIPDPVREEVVRRLERVADRLEAAQSDELLERLAHVEEAVKDLGTEPQNGAEPETLLDVEQVKKVTGLSYYAIRNRRDELGCVSRPNAPLKFAESRVRAFLRGETQPGQGPSPLPGRPRRRSKSRAKLLPIKGERAA